MNFPGRPGLEFRYHKDVERAHGLPEPARQVAFTTRDGRRGRRDRVYEPYGVVIELDGRLGRARPCSAGCPVAAKEPRD